MNKEQVMKKFDELIESLKDWIQNPEYVITTTSSCPPHDLIDYHYAGAWSASVPPPNKICKKCLITLTV